MTISRIRGLKYFGLSIVLTLVGVILALVLNLGVEAQNQTLFSDNFEDGNADGWANVYDPADAIPAAARFLKAHGAPGHIRAAVFAYNPSTAYVNKVLGQAARYADHGAQAIAAPAAPACGQAAIGPLPANGIAAAVISYADAATYGAGPPA